MKETKKILSAILVLSMMLSMIVLPVSAAQTYDYALTENVAQEYTLKYGETAYFHFEVDETGWYLLYGANDRSPTAWGLYGNSEVDYSEYIEVRFWNDPTAEYFGTAVYGEAGKNYTCTVNNMSTSPVTNTLTLIKAQKYDTFKLDQTEAVSSVGEELILSIERGPQFAYEPITWTISDPTVAARQENTNEDIACLALLSPGTATITATTESGLRATCDVTVTAAAIEEENADPIALDQPIAVDIPTHEKIKYAFTPEEDGTYIVHMDAQNNPSFVVRKALSGAELTGTRWIRPAAAGGGYAYRMNKDTTYIIELENRHLYPSISGNLAVNKAELYQSLEITGDSVSFAGGTASLWITGSPVFAMETLTCTSSDPAIAQITSASNSYVTLDCLSPGTVTVTVTAPGGASASCELTVKQPLTLTQDKALLLQIPYGMEETVEFTPTESGRYIFYCADGGTLNMEARIKDGTDQYTPHSWENADGTLHGYAFYMVSGRTYTITVTNYGSSQTFRLTAVKAGDYTSLSFPQDSYTGRVDSIIRLKAITDPEFASEELTWSSSDSSVVHIYDTDSLSQTADLLAPGEATVTLSTADGRVSASCKITVTDKPVLLPGQGLELTIPYNKYEVLTFTAPEDGRYIFYTPGDTHYHTYAYEAETSGDLEAMQWQNADKTLSGYVFDMLGGHRYEVTLNNYLLEAGLTTTLTAVKAEKYDSIRLDKTEIVTRIDSFHELKLISTPEFAYEDVTWTCSDPEMISLFSTSSMGAELFVKTGGTATVTATTASGLSASCTVTTQPTSSFVLNETREVQLYADTPYTRLYFIAPESGTYSFYKNSQVPIAVTADDPNTGEEFDLDFYFKGNYHVADLELDAGQTVCFVLHYHEDADTTLEVGVGQLAPVQEIRLSHTDIVVAPESGILLEQILLPVVCYDEKITVTSSDELIAAYLETATEENYTCHLVVTFEELGTAFITVTSESGATATCKVTVMEPEDITEGTLTTPVLPAGGYLLYAFTPAASGTYTVSDISADSVLDMHVVNSSLRGENWSAGQTSGSKLVLEAEQMAWVSVKNDSDTAQAFTITLEEGYHEHLPLFVPKQEPGYTTPGMEAHCACPCGALFLDDAGTMPVTEEELLIPQRIPVEDARADIGYEVLLDAAETAENGSITIPLADAGEIRSADLSASALAQVAEKDISLTLEMPIAAVTMDAAALANIAEKAGAVPVTLKITEVDEEDLSESQMAAIEELDQNLAYIFSAELMVTNQSIASEDNGGFGSGKATVRIPMRLAGDEYKVVYLADDGSVEVIENTVYEDGILTMELEHFSTYAILQDSMPGDVNDDGDINVLDLMYLANYFARGEVINKANADVNADGTVDVRDLMYLANFFAGKETTLG